MTAAITTLINNLTNVTVNIRTADEITKSQAARARRLGCDITNLNVSVYGTSRGIVLANRYDRSQGIAGFVVAYRA